MRQSDERVFRAQKLKVITVTQELLLVFVDFAVAIEVCRARVVIVIVVVVVRENRYIRNRVIRANNYVIIISTRGICVSSAVYIETTVAMCSGLDENCFSRR